MTTPRILRRMRPWGSWLLLFLAASTLVGCPKSQIIKPGDNPPDGPNRPNRPDNPPDTPPPSNSQPVVKFLTLQPSGRIRYRISNRSDRTFSRLLIAIKGVRCQGRSSRWIAVYRKPIAPGQSRVLLTAVSSTCSNYRIKALAIRPKTTQLAVRIVRFRRGTVYYYVRNKSLRKAVIGGIMVRIQATGCRTPSGEKNLTYFYRYPLQPGSRLRLRTRLGTICRRVKVSAQKRPAGAPRNFAPGINRFGGGSNDNPFGSGGVNNPGSGREF